MELDNPISILKSWYLYSGRTFNNYTYHIWSTVLEVEESRLSLGPCAAARSEQKLEPWNNQNMQFLGNPICAHMMSTSET